MGKALTLLLIILLALASGTGYLFLTEKIAAGERQIADGQRQLEQGQSALEEGKAKLEAGKAKLEKGKAKLEAGKRELSEGKKEYEKAKDNPFLVLADKLLKGGKGFKEASEQVAKGDKQVAKGDKQVAKGEGKVNVGERRLDAGELELRRGREQLRLAKGARVACAFGAAFFAFLSIVLGFCWRRSLARIFMHTDASQGTSPWGWRRWRGFPSELRTAGFGAIRRRYPLLIASGFTIAYYLWLDFIPETCEIGEQIMPPKKPRARQDETPPPRRRGRPDLGIRSGYKRVEIAFAPAVYEAIAWLADRQQMQTGKTTRRADVVRAAVVAYLQKHLPDAGF